MEDPDYHVMMCEKHKELRKIKLTCPHWGKQWIDRITPKVTAINAMKRRSEMMINSRKIEDLNEELQPLARRLIDDCERIGIRLLIYSTFRDFEAQDAIYAQGRTKPGKIVTRARAGQSYHNYKMAFDAVPLDSKGQPAWNASTMIWKNIGECARRLGLEWGGEWKFRDLPHFQLTNGLSLKELQKKYPHGL